MTGIINYGAGNICSVQSAVSSCGGKEVVIDKPGDLKKPDRIILPGVGAFADGMKSLHAKGLVEPLVEAIGKGKPFLGICLGMQMLFSHSEEGDCAGLDLIDGKVKRFSFRNKNIRIPHMGWNRVETGKEPCMLFDGIPNGQYFYFAHSYYAVPDEPSIIAGTTSYGIRFASFVKKNNIVGVQFHPEKSGEDGIKFLKNFLEGKWLR